MVVGLGSMLLQVVCLRQLLSVFSGNELVIGIILAVWLTLAGAGSFVGHRFTSGRAFPASLIITGLIAQLTVLFISGLRPLSGIGLGETISLAATFLLTISSLSLLCFFTGLLFPLAVSFAGGRTALVYGIEAAGACIGGGLYTFFFAGRAGAFAVAAVAAALFILTGALVWGRRSLLLLVILPMLLYFFSGQVNARLSWNAGEPVLRTESRYGEITAFRLRDQVNLFESGKFLFSYPDPQTDEMRAHIPMSVHPAPAAILVIGGSPALLTHLAAYPVRTADFVEMDPALIKAGLSLLSAEDHRIGDDRRFRIIARDARRFIKEQEAPGYDLIIMNLPDPSTASVNRYYTADFFREARAVLNQGGILSLTVPTSTGYVGRRMQTANGAIATSLRKSFRNVSASSAEYGYLFASDSTISTDPSLLAARFEGRAIKTSYFIPSIFRDAFDPLKTDITTRRLFSISVGNTDSRPVAYLYNLMLWAEAHGRLFNKILDAGSFRIMAILAAAALLGGAIALGKRRVVYFSIFTTGYASMSLSVIIILAYQAAFGYVYESIGLLIAVFMLGMAAGSIVGRANSHPLNSLRGAEAAAAVLFAAGAFLPHAAIFFYLLNLLCGVVAGMAFAFASGFASGNDTEEAGRLYAADLAGSCAGALVSSLALVPLAGVQNALYSLVCLKCMSLLLLLTVRDEAH